MVSTEQRAEIRQRWDTYQKEQLTTSAIAGGGDAPAVGDTPVQGGSSVASPVSLFPAAPALPLDTQGQPVQAHRARISMWPVYNAAVARPIHRKELQSNPAAMKALAIEAEKLKSRGTWDLTSVR